jgi:uncharacterized RDD family membrane protein YckC
MRCPKCDYVSFEEQGRCRNCGYDLSLADPSLATPKPGASPFDDLASGAPSQPRDPVRSFSRGASRTPAGQQGFDLPLFEGPRTGTGAGTDTPLVPAPVTVRPPVAVGRGATDTPPATPSPTPSVGELRLDLDLSRREPSQESPAELDIKTLRDDAPGARPAVEVRATPDFAAAVTIAPISGRLLAGLIDIAILAGVDALVTYFTLHLLGLRVDELWRLPLAPFLAFLVLLAMGYLTMFTVLSGQTMGKMATGIRVVGRDGLPVRFGSAVVRAAVQILTIPPLGIGFLPALLSTDHRALHDRVADTMVVVRGR